MQAPPFYISILFILTTMLTLWFLFKAGADRKALIVIVVWLIVQAIIASGGFYTDMHSMPPRLMFLLLPALVTIIIVFATPKGRLWINALDIQWLTYLHIVRIPVEVTLLLLYINWQIPKLMTFEGANPDILSGITAPVVAYLFFNKKTLSPKVLLGWNIVCLLLLINIVIRAILSAPYPFQLMGFEQPNVAVLYFPFIWLPGVVVPAVLFAHLVCIRQLIKTLH